LKSGRRRLKTNAIWSSWIDSGHKPRRTDHEETASFIGSDDVCDYLDFVIVAGIEHDFFTVLLDDLKQCGIKKLALRPLRPDSTVLTQLVGVARSRGYEILFQSEDVSLELDLPATWNEYLAILNNKQRHEVRRKLRRLWETGAVEHNCVEAGREIKDYMDIFLKLFLLSKDEKAGFMDNKRESFFKSLAKAMLQHRK